MAIFGRESEREQRRAERVREFVLARSPWAVVSAALGLLAVVDFVVMLSLVFGPIAIVLGVVGLRDLKRRPHLLGRRLCWAGIIMGVLGMLATKVFWYFVGRS